MPRNANRNISNSWSANSCAATSRICDSDAWATIYGEYPQIMVAMLAPDLPDAQRVLNSVEWGKLREQLFTFVKNYSSKVIPIKGGFQF